ncbi:MAG: hypothetical protein ACAI38_12245 [Myxococcota bacterium]
MSTTKAPPVAAPAQPQSTTDARGPGSVQADSTARARLFGAMSASERAAATRVLQSGASGPFAEVLAAYESAVSKPLA